MRDHVLEALCCPYCEAVGTCVPSRAQGEAHEYRCRCGRGHTRKASAPEHVYAFFPADVDASVDPDIKPLFDFDPLPDVEVTAQ